MNFSLTMNKKKTNMKYSLVGDNNFKRNTIVSKPNRIHTNPETKKNNEEETRNIWF